MKITQRRERETLTTFHRSFRWKDHPSSGYSFECTPDGRPELHNPDAVRNFAVALERVRAGELVDLGVETYVNHYTHPAWGPCDVCGRRVYLEGPDISTCECGADYNLSGQRMAPRSQWGEETGETAADILGPAPREDWG